MQSPLRRLPAYTNRADAFPLPWVQHSGSDRTSQMIALFHETCTASAGPLATTLPERPDAYNCPEACRK